MVRLFLIVTILAVTSGFSAAQEKIAATLYKKPSCMCCDEYANYLRANGMSVTVVEHPNMTLIKQKYGVRHGLASCHTTVIGDYAVEGHVPIAPIKRLLAERPAIKGIALPDMPQGSPGMSGAKQGPFEILSITDHDGPAQVYATE